MLKLKLNLIYFRIKDFFIKLYIRYTMRPGELRRAVKKARRLHEKDGRRYRVFYFGYRYHAWNRRDIRRQLNSGIFKDGLKTGIDFDKIAFFDTDNPDRYVSKS